jgi:hypothetical protein
VEEKMTMEDIPMQTETVGDMETEGIEEFREMGRWRWKGWRRSP